MKMQKLIIFHYHLNPGGVTRIIESQAESLRHISKNIEIIVLAGDCFNDDILKRNNVQLIINPALNYLTETEDLANKFEIIKSIFSQHVDKNCIIHAHNLNLGKNPLVTKALSDISKTGIPLINHCHDFAEDRPANMELYNSIARELNFNLKECMYPEIDNYTYITLNSFDKNRLISYGIHADKVSVLPNPVSFSIQDLSIKQAKESINKTLQLDANKLIATYPVRVIRRKNIGEFILLAALLRDKANWLVTQPPKNPVEIEHYTPWVEFCKKEDIKVVFEAGTRVNFEELLTATDFCVSTSVQEGFGMVFMEPWLINTPVVGRNIEMVTVDIKAAEIQFPLLYNEIKIDYNNKQTDFASLDANAQREVIKECLQNKNYAIKVMDLNPFIANLLNNISPDIIQKNKSIIKEEFSIEKYGTKLNGIYQKLIG